MLSQELHQGLVHILVMLMVIVCIKDRTELFNVRFCGFFQPKIRVGNRVRNEVPRLQRQDLRQEEGKHAMRTKCGHRWNHRC